MAKFAAFLRGVNVGGVNLKMAEVATALTDAGFCNVRTILASGNVLLESTCGAAEVREKTEATLRERFGYDAWALIYDVDTVRTIVAAYPFECELEGYQSYVTFVADAAILDELSASPTQPALTRTSVVDPTLLASSTGRYPRAAPWTAPSARRWARSATSRRPRPATCARWLRCCGECP